MNARQGDAGTPAYCNAYNRLYNRGTEVTILLGFLQATPKRWVDNQADVDLSYNSILPMGGLAWVWMAS